MIFKYIIYTYLGGNVKIMKKSKLTNKSAGLERHIDDLGRIVIPKEMREKLNFEKNEKVSITLFEDRIEITKSKTRCLFCNTQEDLKSYNNYSLCQSCIDDMIKQFN